jgi:nucleoside-diphosphate-sugar epimerase
MTEPESDAHILTNVLAGKTLIRTLYEMGLERFIFIGSANEYGSRTGLLTEQMAPVGRLTNYAKAKSQVGQYGLEQAEQYGRTFIHVRLFYVYGPGQRPSSLINTLCRCYITDSVVDLRPCEHFREYIYVEDVVNGILQMCQLGHSAIINLGSGSAIKLKDFVQLFWSRLGGSPDRLNFGALPASWDEPEQPYSFASLETLTRLTNWRPTISIDEGIQMTIKQLRREPSVN